MKVNNNEPQNNCRALDQWFAGKRRLFILATKGDCGLDFNARLVYSFLVSRMRFEASASKSMIARYLGIHRRTTADAIETLLAVDLAAKTDDGFTALEPTGDVAGWFVARKTTGIDWWEQLAFFPVYLPKPKSSLSPRYSVLLFLLHSLARGSAAAKHQTYRGLGKMLGMNHETAKRALDRLCGLGLAEIFRGESQSDWFAVGLARPSADHLKLFQDADPGTQDEYLGLDDFLQDDKTEEPATIPMKANRAREEFAAQVATMRKAGFPENVIDNVLDLLVGPLAEMPFNMIGEYLIEALREHQASQRQGKYLDRKHCGYLYLDKLHRRAKRQADQRQRELSMCG